MSIGDKYDRSEAGIVVPWIQKHCVVLWDPGAGLLLSEAQRGSCHRLGCGGSKHSRGAQARRVVCPPLDTRYPAAA
jgi:hypothetical protein